MWSTMVSEIIFVASFKRCDCNPSFLCHLSALNVKCKSSEYHQLLCRRMSVIHDVSSLAHRYIVRFYSSSRLKWIIGIVVHWSLFTTSLRANCSFSIGKHSQLTKLNDIPGLLCFWIGFYYIDPNQGCPYDALLAFCNFTANGATCLPTKENEVLLLRNM